MNLGASIIVSIIPWNTSLNLEVIISKFGVRATSPSAKESLKVK